MTCEVARSEAEKSELVVRGPAGEGDAVDADGGDAEDDEEADIDVGDVEHVDALDAGNGSEGDDGDGDERTGEGDDGRENEERLFGGHRHEIFLEEELDAVGERLEKAEGADARGSPAVLHAAENLALKQNGVSHSRQRNDEYDDDLEDREQQKGLEVGQVHSLISSPLVVMQWCRRTRLQCESESAAHRPDTAEHR